MKKYKVKEIFGPTLQGEGSASGTVVLFLRLVGCNKWTGLEKDRENAICKFCDTNFRDGESMTVDEIIAGLKSASHAVKTVVVSGGEPTLQIDKELCSGLVEAGYRLHLETNGSKDIPDLFQFFEHITMSPKQGRSETKLSKCDNVKVLYPAIRHDITLEEFDSFDAKEKFLQAVWDKDYEANLRATICRLYGNPSWRLSLQTHKILGVQ